MPFFDNYPYTNLHNVNLDWILQRVKEWGELVERNDQAFKDLQEANEAFKEYVTTYLQNLDVQEEINKKLDDLLESGELQEYIAPYITTDVGNWLSTHLEPTTPPVDDTLSIRGAAADSKTVGDVLKSQQTEFRRLVSIEYADSIIDNTFINTGADPVNPTPISNNLWQSFIASAEEGDQFILDLSGGGTVRCYVFTDSDYNVLSGSSPAASVSGTFTAPAGTAFIIGNNLKTADKKPIIKKFLSTFGSDFVALDMWTSGIYWDPSSAYYDISNPLQNDIMDCMFLGVEPGMIFYVNSTSSQFSCAYAFLDSSFKVISYTVNKTLYFDPITIPAGCCYVYFSNIHSRLSTPNVIVKRDIIPSLKYVVTRLNFIEMLDKATQYHDITLICGGGRYPMFDSVHNETYWKNKRPATRYCGNILKNGIHLIGHGKVIFDAIYTGTDSDIKENFSLFNVAGDFILENVGAEVRNICYIVHDDSPIINANIISYGVLKDCNFRHLGSDHTFTYGAPICIGGGISHYTYRRFTGGRYETLADLRTISYHTAANAIGELIFTGLAVYTGTIRFKYMSGGVINSVINNCKLNTGIIGSDEQGVTVDEWNNYIFE